MPSDKSFRDSVRSYNKEYQNAQPIGDDWYPPLGEYTVTVTEVETGSYEKNGETTHFVKPIAMILDGEFEGQQYPLGFYPIPTALGALKGLVRGLNDGVEPENIDEALDVLDRVEQEEIVAVVELDSFESNKSGRTIHTTEVMEVFTSDKS